MNNWLSFQISFIFLSLTSYSQSVDSSGLGFFKVFNTSPLPQLEDELTASFFAKNRERLREVLPDSSVIALFSSPIKTKSNDIEFPHHQDADFYYFTGIKDENAMLLLFKDPILIEENWYREILFVEDRNPSREMWTGPMVSPEDAKEISGVGAVMSNKAFKYIDAGWESFEHFFANAHLFVEVDDTKHPGDIASLINHYYTKAARAQKTVKTNEAEDLIAGLRQQKLSEELPIIQRAIDITCEAQNNVIRMVQPGMTEYQLEAIIEYTFRYLGGDGPAFPSIVASGENGGVMHYTQNEAVLIPGDLVVVDIGAQYKQYAADVTRTIPISGKFTEEQKKIYQLVLDAQTVAIRYAKPGYKFWTPHEEAYRTIGKGLIQLGIIKEWSEIGNYFTHGTSHYLGLDVHDAGVYSALQPGEIITVEPGVYIPKGSPCDEKWWGIFVRIEDDVLITEGEPKVLSAASPKTVSELEAMMRKPEKIEP